MNREEPSSAAAPYDAKAVGASSTGKVHVFAIFDTEHDGDLYDQLSAHARFPSCEFEVTGGSVRSRDTDVWRDRVRRGIRHADQVIVICGEHTEASSFVHAELLISREEGTPYFLLWGRRELMCTKPIGTKSDEGMFSWTREIVRDQINLSLRSARSQANAKSLSNPPRKAADTP